MVKVLNVILKSPLFEFCQEKYVNKDSTSSSYLAEIYRESNQTSIWSSVSPKNFQTDNYHCIILLTISTTQNLLNRLKQSKVNDLKNKRFSMISAKKKSWDLNCCKNDCNEKRWASYQNEREKEASWQKTQQSRLRKLAKKEYLGSQRPTKTIDPKW